jgi:hypothetical protein
LTHASSDAATHVRHIVIEPTSGWVALRLVEPCATAAAPRPALRRELWRCRHPLGDWLLDQISFLGRRVERVWQ